MMRLKWWEALKRAGVGDTASISFSMDGKNYQRIFRTETRLILLGAGHVAQALCGYGAELGFRVNVVDDRPEFITQERFPQAAQLLCGSYPAVIRDLKIGTQDFVAVMTRGHRYDTLCVCAILEGELPSYLGVIGSRHKAQALLELLATEGFSRETLDKIHTPIGLDIGALTVQEIAVSIAAELIQHRRKKTPRAHGATLLIEDGLDPALAVATQQQEKNWVLAMVYETTGSTPAKTGAMMLADRTGNTIGTVGGGNGEYRVVQQARSIAGTGDCISMTLDLDNPLAEPEGMVCGGTMKVMLIDLGEPEER